MPSPPLYQLHVLWAVAGVWVGAMIYGYGKRSATAAFASFARFLFVWSVLFYGSFAGFHYAAVAVDSPLIASLGFVIPHLFQFVALGYLWAAVGRFQGSEYTHLFWLFLGYGILFAAMGLVTLPSPSGTGTILVGPETLYTRMISVGLVVSSLMIGGTAFEEASRLSGGERIRHAWLGVAVIVAVLAGILSTLGGGVFALAGHVANPVWMAMFLVFVYWPEFFGEG